MVYFSCVYCLPLSPPWFIFVLLFLIINFRQKFQVWAWNMWNPCDASAIIFFLIGLSLRFQPTYRPVGRVIYCVDSIYWYLRILNILGVNKYLGEWPRQQ